LRAVLAPLVVIDGRSKILAREGIFCFTFGPTPL
jgi:hypothetical protein